MPETEPENTPRGAPVGRRTLLGMLGAGAAGLAAAPYLQAGWEGLLGKASQLDPTGLTGLLPNPGGFRYYSVVGSVPRKGETDYALTIDGLVHRPRTYTLADLRAFPQTRVVHDVRCTDGWRVAKVPFDGVKLSDLLDDAGVGPGGEALSFGCFDGAYTESLTLEQARRDDVLVALRMQDAPITHEHGGPVRLYVAPMYFYKSAKWLSGVSVTGRVVPGYWEQRGYDVDGWLDDAH
ncbi:molybdopterin-dependent oxidoreductase [Nocardia sp. BMG111209]|uniref:molybdopterin-dependent oxidoreductase n=1 Tax=Nocardia sp. BMG111209 TaxID=1160137 RepID=UPI00037B6A15|nr:molybdopterin-dependent oxidoreductase [Nocardia sp. BMG111209]